MKRVKILESLAGFDTELKQTYQYQKGEVVIISAKRYESIKGLCEVLKNEATKPEKRPNDSRKEKRG